LIAINTLLAGCSGGLCVFFYNYSTTTSKVKDSTIHIGMGIIAGLTSVTSSADVVQPWAILIIGVIGGFVYILTCKIMKRIKVDDPLDAVSIHAGCGIWGLF
jgi:Amt family ammonium transporter